MKRALLAACLVFAVPGAAPAQERPDEDALFGAPAAEPAKSPAEPAGRPSEDSLFAPAASAEPQPTQGRPDEGALFGGGATQPAPDANKEIVPEDPLRIGGQLYLRAATSMSTEVPPSKWTFSVPSLLDVYLDARPNERVRGYALGRLQYDPTIPEAGSTPFATGEQLAVLLDQLWLRFDVGRSVFVTAGRQHVKWGPSHFWNPTDYLHQVRRDPLAVLDQRVGTTMLKLQVPWEKYGWNLYAVGLFEDAIADQTLARVGGALRMEAVVGPAEIGLAALVQKGHNARLAADVSAGLGPIDVYAEAAVRHGWETPLWRLASSPDPTLGAPGLYEQYTDDGWVVQASGGVSWALSYMDVNVLTFGAEYFYNQVGVSDSKLYPWLLSQGAYTPFYVGQHYLGVYGMLSAPASWRNLNLVLSNIGNLSDRSFVARLDVSFVVLTHLRIEAYTAWHYGHKGGEFRFNLDVPATGTTPGYSMPTPLAEFGLGVRVSI